MAIHTNLERPTSAIPKKDPLMNYIESLIDFYIQNPEEKSMIYRLVRDENEYILAAFDVFKSDKDQENLLDTLQRIIKKYRNEF